ncbi:MAG: hypothetical protein Q8927_20705, partial [Bacteroidota bacterium]|nr:hypothetical protein [Bacteroidota bacterium]
MKRNLLNILLILALSFASSYVLAETSDNFNSRTGVSLRAVKGYLQGNCWFFSDFDVNRDGWAPRMEGDGAMVSGSGANATARTGIYTPLLDIKGVTSVSFSYTFNRPVNDRRWIKLYAADADDKSIRLLDSLELTGLADQIIYTYRKSFTTIPAGQYKLFINYQGIGGEERIAIDQLTVSATRHYASTCNTAPVAGKDRFTGTAFHTAI